MEMTTYYGMDKNPFIKDAAVSTLFTSNDFKQMTNRLEFIIRSRGIGVFLSSPGMGKTTCLRKTLAALNPNRYAVIYICMTTITAIDFTECLMMHLVLKKQLKNRRCSNRYRMNSKD